MWKRGGWKYSRCDYLPPEEPILKHEGGKEKLSVLIKRETEPAAAGVNKEEEGKKAIRLKEESTRREKDENSGRLRRSSVRWARRRS